MAYFIFKGGNVNASKKAMRQYLVRSQVNQVFSSRTDQVLTKIRDVLRSAQEGDGGTFALKSPSFGMDELVGCNLPNDRTFKMNAEDIEELLSATKGPYTFLVLSLLYPQLRFNEVQFHQDHIHPWSQFSDAKLKPLGLTPAKVSEWQIKRDQLPNLQLMEGSENQSKNATPFVAWLNVQPNQEHFLQTNMITHGLNLEIKEFDHFFETRKGILHDRLSDVFDVSA